MDLIWLALAGGLGTLSRYGVTRAVVAVCGDGFPWGTLTVNVVGSLVFGIVWALLEARGALDSRARALILLGFLGAFTTFSSYAFETVDLVVQGQLGRAALNLLANNLGALGAFVLGWSATRALA